MYQHPFHTAGMNPSAHIGRFESTLEDGTLRFYYHEVGHFNGFSTRMTQEETLQLLEWLTRNQDAIRNADHPQKTVREEQGCSRSVV